MNLSQLTKNATLLMFMSVVTLLSASVAQSASLSILAPEGYISPELAKDFEKEHGTKINITHYVSNDIRDFLIESGNFDLAITSEKSALDFVLDGHASALDSALSKKNPQSKNHHLQNYAMELSRDYLGVSYNKDKAVEPSSWKDVFELTQRMEGRVLIPNNHDDLMDSALMAGGASVTRYTESEIIASGKILRNFISRVKPDMVRLANKNYYYAISTSTDAYLQSLGNPSINFVFPGGETRVRKHYILVGRKTMHPTLSNDFIDMISSKDGAIKQSLYHYYPVSNVEATESLMRNPETSEFFNVLYPQVGIESQNARHVEKRLELKKYYIYKRVVN